MLLKATHSSIATTHFLKPAISFHRPVISSAHFPPLRTKPCRKSFKIRPLQCSASVVSDPPQLESLSANYRPFPAEISRTVMELSTAGTVSTLYQDGWPLAIGVRFAVDPEGTPVLCLNEASRKFSIDRRCSLHVQLDQCGLRTPQCTIQGKLEKPEDRILLKKLCSVWRKRFAEEVDEDRLYIISVDQVLQIEDYAEEGRWITSSEYKLANPDPLRDFAERIVNEINAHNSEDVVRFCNIYVDLDFQVTVAKMVWMDRLGFDVRLSSPEEDTFEVRIPFPREVGDEKGAKSSFNGMSQTAWEVEKNFRVPDFEKVKHLKKMGVRRP